MAKRLSVVISQSPSKNPGKKKLEEDILAGLLMENGIDVTIVPNLYDISPDSTGMLALKGIGGNMVVISWLFERAAHWTLDRNAIHGHIGTTLLVNEDEEDEEDADDNDDDNEDDNKDEKEKKARVIDSRQVPNRKIYCLDLKISNRAEEFISEVKRIHTENAVQVVGLGDIINAAPVGRPSSGGAGTNGAMNGAATNGAATNGVATNGAGNGSANHVLNIIPGNSAAGSSNGLDAAARMLNPTNDTALAMEGGLDQPSIVNRIESTGGRRWYPVIDFSRCTNCMECIDFCLFGVYGVDNIDTILVEQPDNCRKGCPACSRVCPENAIMFPQHKTPAIAGSMDVASSLKIDLSQLFGAPADGKTAEEIAAMERDEQLIAAGREAVGIVPRRGTGREAEPKDELDSLVDQLNDLDI